MQSAQTTEAEIRLHNDNGGRRQGGDRRIYSYHGCLPERRSGKDRRNGVDRRKNPRP